MGWKNKNVLITGINGFIGTALARRLLLEGANVSGLVKEISHAADILYHGNCKLFTGDICDYTTLSEIISLQEIDVIFHFAAFAIVRSSSKDPMSTYRINVMGTVNVLEAARNVGRCKSIVVASSDKAYGDHEELPYTEDFALQPKNTYDTSKACMDMIARSYAHNYDMPICVTRCSNVYGPGDMSLSRIVPNTIKLILDGKGPMLYSDIESMEREFIYIDDVVEAYLKLGTGYCALKPIKAPQGEAYNIGGTGPVKIYDLAAKISELMGSKKKPFVSRRDPLFKEIQRQYIDASKLLTIHAWKPQIDLDEGLKRTVEWYKSFYIDGEYK